ncbi:KUP/HAK/KT family potassium transporter [Methanosarcina barkeri]|uniref:KUP/HAK/KT family potassium transporter n=1 Tax=Methanosarcina barkeri TaxID=2208 RepID=UPI002436C3EB|nr:KUP/HAK/KT family potassium transporter [Methanosarcina barkeri]
MGHLGREPILKAWRFVFVALVLNYLGRVHFLSETRVRQIFVSDDKPAGKHFLYSVPPPEHRSYNYRFSGYDK